MAQLRVKIITRKHLAIKHTKPARGYFTMTDNYKRKKEKRRASPPTRDDNKQKVTKKKKPYIHPSFNVESTG